MTLKSVAEIALPAGSPADVGRSLVGDGKTSVIFRPARSARPNHGNCRGEGEIGLASRNLEKRKPLKPVP